MQKTLLVAVIFAIFCLPYGRANAKENTTETTILENGQYFNGKVFVHFAEIVIKNGKIAAINSSKTQTAGKRIPLQDMYILPGLTDAHVHITGSPAIPYVVVSPLANANSSLNCGVTTMIDLFYPEAYCKQSRDATNEQPSLYSTMYMAGPILTAPGGHGTEYGVPTRTITTVAEATKTTGEVIDGGVDVIKLVYQADSRNYVPSLTKEMVAAIVTVAHKRHKKVFAHIDLAAQAVDCAEVGVDVIAHMPVDSLTPRQLEKIKKSGAVIIPTVTVLESVFDGHDAAYMSGALLWRTANPAYLDNFSREAVPKPGSMGKYSKVFATNKYMQNLENCIKMRTPIMAGTDAGNFAVFFGYSLHHEIAQYVKAGMSNADAICSATSSLDMVFPGIKTGKIETGYDADLVVLHADPLTNIENTTAIDMVFHKGEQAKLDSTNKISHSAVDIAAEKPDLSVFHFSALQELPQYILTFTDEKMGGKSTITASLPKDVPGTSLALTGKVIKGSYFGYAGVQINLNGKSKEAPTDLGEYKAVEFEAKGNGGKYFLSLVSDKVKDYNFHSFTFSPAQDWQTIKVPFEELKQMPNRGKAIPLDLKTIIVLEFTAAGGDQDIDFAVRKFSFVK